MTRAPWLLVIVLFALLVGTVTTWIWSRAGANRRSRTTDYTILRR